MTSPPWLVLEIARLARAQAERYAAELGYNADTLVMMCAVASGALTDAYRAAGLDAALAMGRYHGLTEDGEGASDGHFWTLVTTPAPGPAGDRWEPDAGWVRRAHLLDITATQYGAQPRVLALAPADLQRAAYALENLGDAARRRVWERDVPELRELSRRCVGEVRKRQLFWRD
ncbi:hypothetical protein [Sorangium sp. So ce233]|uniref:hypothetical protein n=1 Tax=Sorangium sp. So ce233 TaxID=3133290 RepID=UPI003F6349A3